MSVVDGGGTALDGQVLLVPGQDQGEVAGGERSRVHEEGGEGVEGGARGDVVDQDGTGGASVVGARDGAEALGSGRVPQL